MMKYLLFVLFVAVVVAHEGHHHDHEGEECPFSKASGSKLIGELSYRSPFSSPEEWNIWMDAFKATVAITLGGNAIILLMLSFEITDTFIKRMVAFGIGGLLGDVFLHLIPHAVLREIEEQNSRHHNHHHDHDHHDHHDHEHDAFAVVGLSVLGGLLSFFLLEKVLSVVNPSHSHSHGDHDHSGDKSQLSKYFRPGVVLNLVADAAHNFTDGLALAAAFRLGGGLGVTMTFAITMHEIPHEISDFAVLLNEGISKKAAFFLQFISAIGAIAGCFLGLAFSPEQPGPVLGFTAGGFIYVSLCQLVPELKNSNLSAFEALVQTSLMGAGVYSMIVVGKFEEHDQSH